MRFHPKTQYHGQSRDFKHTMLRFLRRQSFCSDRMSWKSMHFYKTIEPIKGYNAVTHFVQLTVWIPVWNAPTPTTPPATAIKIQPQWKGFCTVSLHFTSTRKDPTSKCRTLIISTSQIPLKTKENCITARHGYNLQLQFAITICNLCGYLSVISASWIGEI